MIPQFIQALSLPEIKAEKGTVLIKEGDLCRNIYIVTKGIARLYFVYRRKELTTQFFFAGEVATSVYSLLKDTHSVYSVDVIEDCHLLVMPKDLCREHLKKDDAFRDWFYHAAMNIEFTHAHHLQDVMSRRAQDRYRQMEVEQPHWLNRIEPRYLASYLGITRTAFHQAKIYDHRKLMIQ